MGRASGFALSPSGGRPEPIKLISIQARSFRPKPMWVDWLPCSSKPPALRGSSFPSYGSFSPPSVLFCLLGSHSGRQSPWSVQDMAVGRRNNCLSPCLAAPGCRHMTSVALALVKYWPLSKCLLENQGQMSNTWHGKIVASI